MVTCPKCNPTPRLLSFAVLGTPVAKARPRVVRLKNGAISTFTPKESRNYESQVREAAARVLEGREWALLEEPFKLTVSAWWPALSSGPKRLRVERPKGTKPDADNVAKCVMDALNGVLWRDDSLVAELVVRKRFAEPSAPARVEVLLERLP